MQKSDAERHVHGVLAAPCRRTSDTSPPQSDTPVPYMQKLCQPSQPAEPKLIFFGNRDTACFQDVLQHPNPLALSLNFVSASRNSVLAKLSLPVRKSFHVVVVYF